MEDRNQTELHVAFSQCISAIFDMIKGTEDSLDGGSLRYGALEHTKGKGLLQCR